MSVAESTPPGGSPALKLTLLHHSQCRAEIQQDADIKQAHMQPDIKQAHVQKIIIMNKTRTFLCESNLQAGST
jgi:hypothetical protein